MALEPPPDPLRRALEAAKAQDSPDDWVVVASTVRERVAALGRAAPTEPLLVRDAGGDLVHDEHGSRAVVSSRAVLSALRRLLLTAPTHAPDGIRLHVDDGELTGVDVSLVGAYGLDLVALAGDVRSQVVEVVTALIGPGGPFGPAQVQIDVVDVVVGDPRVT
ncbi:hypothetical protein ABFT23_06790 [Nocardioides sp. C4-1]|uniref:hypothetical protein n=1 Tax=Nocardioides sp. C4-1 TaxID=3151851 RepID=UPI0032666AD2